MALSTSKDCPFCGSDHKSKPFAIYEDGFHCFSCGKSKRAIRNFRVKQLETSGEIELPELTCNPSMFSLSVLKWLRSYHVTDDLIYKYNIAEAVDNSVITPILEDGKVVMYQRRWFNPRRIMTYGTKKPFIASSTESNTVVIVEDFISAIRVGEVVDCYCMFGTSVQFDTVKELAKKYGTIVVWADGDGPGQNAARKLLDVFKKQLAYENRQRAFTQQSKSILNVCTELDPKFYTNTEIRTILKGDLIHVKKSL